MGKDDSMLTFQTQNPGVSNVKRDPTVYLCRQI